MFLFEVVQQDRKTDRIRDATPPQSAGTRKKAISSRSSRQLLDRKLRYSLNLAHLRTKRVRVAAPDPIFHLDGVIFSAKQRVFARWETLDQKVWIAREEERDRVALFAALVDNAVKVRKVPVVRPAHHQVAQVHHHCSRKRLNVDPSRSRPIKHLEATDHVLQQDRDRSEVGVSADT